MDGFTHSPLVSTTRERAPSRPSHVGRPHLLHELFERRCAAQPDRLAVLSSREAVSYGELDRRANRIAHHLRAHGVRRGDLVALLLPRSADAYAALLGILKAGAAYVPLDPEYPPDRIGAILDDCGAAALVSDDELAPLAASFRGAVVRVDADAAALAAQSSERLDGRAGDGDPHDLCYVIYTSGSTGRPKGVMVEHRSARHLVKAEAALFKVGPEDRVYQGFSLAFDASIEEIWLALHSGATLVSATPEMARSGPDLPRLLERAGVTVLSCVPSLLSMFSDEVATLRLLILGGESCPERLVERFARRRLRIFNTYGPTEATVIATCAELSAGRPVTIGRAIPGYRVHLLDDEAHPARRGAVGQICVAGIGVARGYVGLPDLTAARFVPDPLASEGELDARMFKTGDLGRVDADGNIEFVGRRDDQVKLRGYRVELAEVESALLASKDVLAAACTVREETPGAATLFGYVVPRPGRQVDPQRLRAAMRTRLPPYMVPSWIEPVADLPRLANGKLDRDALPAPRARQASPSADARQPSSELERAIVAVWERLFDPLTVAPDDDFFRDLGGHSLLAARMVSELRRDPRFATISVVDVYQQPTVAQLAALFRTAGAPAAGRSPALRISPSDRDGARTGPRAARSLRLRQLLGGLLQSLAVPLVWTLRGLLWLAPVVLYFLLRDARLSRPLAFAWAAAVALLLPPLLFALVVGTKWLLLGRIRPGRHPVWGWYHVRWWFVQELVRSLPLDDLGGTPLLPFLFRCLGARIGRDVHLASDDLAAFDLITIADGASVDDHVSLLGYAVEEWELVVGPVTIGADCLVGTRSVLREETVMERGARLDDLSLLPRGARVPQGETWAGSPARRVAGSEELPRARPPAPDRLRRVELVALYAVLQLALPILLYGSFVPGLLLLARLDLFERPLAQIAALPLVGASFVLLASLEVLLLKRLLVGRLRAGTWPVHGAVYVRKWILDRLLAHARDVAGSLHATLWLAPWYRALGARIGRFVELSTATSTTPDLLEIDDGGTVADDVTFGAARVERGWMTLAPTRVGRRAFVGNSAVVRGGTALGEGSLIAVASITPADPADVARPFASWLGSPPVLMPRRAATAGGHEARTYAPSPSLRLRRAAFELMRVSFPAAGFVAMASAVVDAALRLAPRVGLGTTLLLMPLVYGAASVAMVAALIALKWLVLGRLRPVERPLWSHFVWRVELVNALYEFMVEPLILEPLKGTPLLPWFFRLMGARVGRLVYLETTDMTEFDLVTIGDRAILNHDCTLQTHLFEDRVLRVSHLKIGDDCVIGRSSVILYDSRMERGSRLDALSLVMKGETLPEGTAWAGIPSLHRLEAARVAPARPRVA